MRKLIIALVAATALSAPAFARPDRADWIGRAARSDQNAAAPAQPVAQVPQAAQVQMADRGGRGGWRGGGNNAGAQQPSGNSGWNRGGGDGGWRHNGGWQQQAQPAPSAAPANQAPVAVQNGGRRWGGQGSVRGGDNGQWQNRSGGFERRDRMIVRPAPQAAPQAVPQDNGWQRDAARSGDDRRWREANRDGSRNRSRNGGTWNGNNGGDRNWNDGDRRRSDGNRNWNGRSGSEWAYRNDGYRSRHKDRHDGWNSGWRNDHRYNWYDYRQRYSSRYRMPRYYNPYGYGYGYSRFSVGLFLDSMFYSDRYWLDDPWDYRLPPAYGSYRWIRYYDDVLLVDLRDGRVVDVIYDFFW